MKYYIIFLIFIEFNICYTQKMPIDFFEEGLVFSKKNQKDSALIYFKRIVDFEPGFKYYKQAVFLLANEYYSKEKYDLSLPLLKMLIVDSSDFIHEVVKHDNDYFFSNIDYKEWSYVMISDIYFIREKYDSSLFYLSINDLIKYNFSIDEKKWTFYDNFKILRYCDILIKLKRNEDALILILNNIWDGFAEEQELIPMLKKVLIDKKYAKELFKQSLKNLQIVSNEYSCNCNFIFYGVKLSLPGDLKVKSKCTKKQLISLIKSTKLYQEIMNY